MFFLSGFFSEFLMLWWKGHCFYFSHSLVFFFTFSNFSFTHYDFWAIFAMSSICFEYFCCCYLVFRAQESTSSEGSLWLHYDLQVQVPHSIQVSHFLKLLSLFCFLLNISLNLCFFSSFMKSSQNNLTLVIILSLLLSQQHMQETANKKK